ncbi:MAG: OsmC family protein [Halothece sp. Uz-M2-17]|nr:OsmC family protein [Halothece sp. Uz-M2-17]
MKQEKVHHYSAQITWKGNQGQGTANYRGYQRCYEIKIDNKPTLQGSADPAFLGDPSLYNPEELLVASLSACHLLWYLHFCADSSIIVTGYIDQPVGTMIQTPEGKGYFSEVILRPLVTIQSPDKIELAKQLHHQAHDYCFIANSVNFSVKYEPSIELEVV